MKKAKFTTTMTPLAMAMGTLLIQPVQAQDLEEIIVTGVRDTHTVRTDDSMVAPPDTGQLLRRMPGANVNKNGELTGIAQYRGMSGNRMNVSINDAHISSGGPNAMDAPLHYAPVALLESLTINRGITPVSAGQETIGGNVEAETYQGDFTASRDFELQSRAYFGAQSVSEGMVASGFFAMANRNNILRTFLMKEKADDSDFGNGEITPSEYDRERFDLGYSHTRGDHTFTADYARNETGDAGTAALPMDIQSVDSDLFNGRYEWDGSGLRVEAKLGFNDIEHWMTNFHLRRPPQGENGNDPMRYRQTFAVGESVDASVQFEQDTGPGLLRYGIDAHLAEHSAVISNPNANAFFIDNFNDVQRDIIGAYGELDTELNNRVDLLAGIRFNRVKMSAGEVSANLNPMNAGGGMPVMMDNMAAMLASQFNNADRSQHDNNVDWFARASLNTRSNIIWYLGAARKTRSPSYQERYLWIPMESTGGLADGKTYTGNPELDPEVSHEVELGFDMDAGNWSVYPRLYYKTVDDFIQGTPATNQTALNFAGMMANMGMGDPEPLQFSNVEARFHGLDIESSYRINNQWNLRAIANLVRGERRDIDDNLYRVAPDNVTLALDYSGDGWMGTVESVHYARQDRVASTHLETETAGYSLINVSGRRIFSSNLEVVVGLNNLFDKAHKDHLAGYNRAYNPDLAMRERLPGLGRNLYARVMWHLR